MRLHNTTARFGLLSRMLHWGMAALVFAAIGVGLYITYSTPSLALFTYFGVHKTLGISLLGLTVLRLIWHRHSAPPRPLPAGAAWKDLAARMVHKALYALLIALPLTGWVASSASGIDTVVFGRWAVPAIAPVDARLEEAGFALHGLLAWALIAMIGLHLCGALLRAARTRDGTLRRMLTGTA